MVTSLAHLPDSRLDELLAAAAELTWVAGPLEKGAGLCHGTAGNGYAFLKMYRRSGDDFWLDRARAFAMHAMAQCDRMAAEHRPAPPFAVDRRRGRRVLRVELHRRRRRAAQPRPVPLARYGPIRAATLCLRRDWGNGAQRAWGCHANEPVMSTAARLG